MIDKTQVQPFKKFAAKYLKIMFNKFSVYKWYR